MTNASSSNQSSTNPNAMDQNPINPEPVIPVQNINQVSLNGQLPPLPDMPSVVGVQSDLNSATDTFQDKELTKPVLNQNDQSAVAFGYQQQPEAAIQPMSQFTQQTVAQPVTQPISEQVSQISAPGSFEQPITQQPITQPVEQPVTQPSIEPLGQPAAQTVTQPIPSPVGYQPEPLAPIDMAEIEKNKNKQKNGDSDGKINIFVAITIIVGVILLFVAITWILISNAKNLKNNKSDNITPTINVNQNTDNINSSDNTQLEGSSESNPAMLEIKDESRLVVNSPLLNQFIPKDGALLSLEGKMKGFFEGTMEFRIIDDVNNEIAKGIINAQGDNTQDFVSFFKQITIEPFNSITAKQGRIDFFETSAKDGTINVVASIPLKFQ